MKKNILVALIGLGLMACNNTTPAPATATESVATQSSELSKSAEEELIKANSKFNGTYTATLPGADKGDNNVEITIVGNTYKRTEKQGEYQFSDEGTLSVENGIITLKATNGEENYFKATPTGFVMLNPEKEEIEGVLASAYHFTKK